MATPPINKSRKEMVLSVPAEEYNGCGNFQFFNLEIIAMEIILMVKRIF